MIYDVLKKNSFGVLIYSHSNTITYCELQAL